jgi:hypothetical protein
VNRDELHKRLRAAVELAEQLPERFQVAAFEAIMAQVGTASHPEIIEPARITPKRARQRSQAPAPTSAVARSESEFFASLAAESGESESDLRSTFHLADSSRVSLLPAARNLGRNRAEQARTTIILVASARAYGLDERPVSMDAVRLEVQSKHCYNGRKFVSDDLGSLKAFHRPPGASNILVTPKWLEEFKPALDRALGRTSATEE